ncbi:MAG: hypothetical protein BCS36_08160 [Desulfovibrio sp. MES5]|uniref:hypothetical protein n=1 Tax=Desulfovibrio sp. MES5 TaxID=1899016 RepID=UPI000B9CE67A|nr:hypothetical protein [Desulfovibrio sp. MES5]OXS29373.1 MAG: hypothetical protein BCS36_08160 [Desulfovibrio sp. MES5]
MQGERASSDATKHVTGEDIETLRHGDKGSSVVLGETAPEKQRVSQHKVFTATRAAMRRFL